MDFPKSRKRSSSRRRISPEMNEEIKKYSEESAKQGILPGSEKFLEGLTKIINRNARKETRVACEIGVKGVQGFVFKPPDRTGDPWWMHILDHQGDILYGFNMYELSRLADDLVARTGVTYSKLPERKDDRVAVVREMIELAIEKEAKKPKITGQIAWGNGEPCPICKEPFQVPDIVHLLSHPEAHKMLFGEEKEVK